MVEFMDSLIPVAVPFLCGKEKEYVNNCLDTGWISSNGSYVRKFEQLCTEDTGHSDGITVLEESEMIEVKQGPYLEKDDKVRFEAVAEEKIVIKGEQSE
jgi:dTDP-4-amino-4,6-dideoxygalactose transaminase